MRVAPHIVLRKIPQTARLMIVTLQCSPSDVNVLRVIPQTSLVDEERYLVLQRIALWYPSSKICTEDVMKKAHDTPLSIHPGSTKMYQDICQRFWWPNMKRDIAQYVVECDVCCRIKAEHQKACRNTFNRFQFPEWKWDKVEIDFIICISQISKGS